jgi:hypothetical protein
MFFLDYTIENVLKMKNVTYKEKYVCLFAKKIDLGHKKFSSCQKRVVSLRNKFCLGEPTNKFNIVMVFLITICAVVFYAYSTVQ